MSKSYSVKELVNTILPEKEQLDFTMLLQLLPLIEEDGDYKDFAALFSIIGIDKLLLLCKYKGNATIKIPTLQELTAEIDALQWYSDIYISHIKTEEDIPDGNRMKGRVSKIWHIIDKKKQEENARNDKEKNKGS